MSFYNVPFFNFVYFLYSLRLLLSFQVCLQFCDTEWQV